MTTTELFGLLIGSSALSAGVTAFATRKATMLTAFTGAYTALAKRVTDLETRLGELESKLGSERELHSRTRELLRIAVRHIRDVIAWGASDRAAPLPPPPAELLVEL